MINNDNFLVKEIPVYHPITQKYDRLEFWRTQKRRCIEGYWSGGKWMPPELYYYVNFHTITYEDGAFRGTGRPWLRDIEWEKAYIYAEATGFSGFELDDEYTCHRWYGPEKEKALKYGWITEAELDKKKYIDAREYLKKIHPKSLGKPLYENESKHIIDLESRGGGKDLHYKSTIYKENGPDIIDNVNVGDYIFGDDGKLTNVVDKKIFYDQVQYRVTLSDGRFVLCGPGHLWTVRDHYGNILTKELGEIKNKYFYIRKTGVKDYLYSVKQNDPVEFNGKNPDIDPYYLGLWLGDGNSHNAGITTMDPEIVEYIYHIKDLYGLKKVTINHKPGNKAATYTITNGGKGGDGGYSNQLINKLRKLNLIKNKHIPNAVLYSSVEYRLQVLQGLMDSDGYVEHNGNYEISTSYDGLKNTLSELLGGLGIRYKKVKKAKAVRFRFNTSLDVVRLSRKKVNINNNPSKYAQTNRSYSKIVNIEEVGIDKSICIAVDNSSKLFLTNDYIVTHNSFWASGCIMHNFLFDGARDYDDYLAKRLAGTPLKSEGIVGAINAIYSNDLLAKVKVAFEYLPDRQIVNTGREDELFPSPLWVDHSGSLAPSRFIISKVSGSILHHRTFGDNPLAANATRPNRVWLDEVGFMDNIKAAWEGIESTQASAQFKRLTIHAMGTGGLTSGGAALYTQEMFYNSEAYGALVFDDVWENKGKIGYFLPGEYTLNRFKEGPNYITNFDLAKQYIDEEREEARKSGSISKYMGTVINKPQKPSEIFLRAEGSFFQVAALKNRLSDLEARDSLLHATYKYEFDIVNNKVIPRISDKRPIREFPLPKGASMDAPVELYELPRKGQNGEITAGRYIAGWDPVSSDGNEDTERSLQSMFILDTWTDRIVAEYTARTYLHDDYYEQARRLLIYFNARCNYEKNIKGPYAYFKNKNSLHLLIETPEILKDMSLATTKPTVGNSSLGTQTSQGVTNWGLSLIKTWLAKEAYDHEGTNLDRLMSPGLIKELISYTPDINVDRIMALIMTMIYREDVFKYIDMMKSESVITKSSDKFWDRAFNNKHYNRGLQSLSMAR